MLTDTKLRSLCDCGHEKRQHHLAPASPYHGSCNQCNCPYFEAHPGVRFVPMYRDALGRLHSKPPEGSA